MQFFKAAVIFALCMLLSACGFHVRGSTPLPAGIHTLYLKTPNAYDEITKILKQALIKHDITLVSNTNQAPYTLVIEQEVQHREATTVSASTELVQYTLYYKLRYSVAKQNGQVVLGPTEINLQNRYASNTNQIMGSSAEEIQLYRQMRFSAVMQLISQLSSPDAFAALNK